MVVLSKLLEEIRYFKCQDLLHEGSCTTRSYADIYRFLLCNIKYFAPTIFLPLLVKLKHINRDRLLDALKLYLYATLIGTMTATSISTSMCLFRHFFGEFKLYTLTFWPTVIGGLPALLGSDRTLTLYKVSTVQMFIEIWLKRQKNWFTRAVANSIKWQTLLFMLCSAVIMEAKRAQIYNGFWLLQPNPKRAVNCENNESVCDGSNSKCQHAGIRCVDYLKNGLRSYVALGLTLDVIKCAMASINKDKAGVIAILLGKIKQFRLNTTLLFALYVSIYRHTNCYLNRRAVEVPFLNNHLIASFLSGICYPLQPKMSLLTYAITISLEICWSFWCNQKSDHDTDFVKLIKRLPVDKIFYPFCLAYAVHVYTLRPQFTTFFSQSIINGVTNNYAKNIATKLLAIQTQLEQRKL